MPTKEYRRLVFAVVLAILLGAVSAEALINPHFTPVHLVKQSELILWVDLKPGTAKDGLAAMVREVLKGKTETKTFSIELSKAINTQSADALRELAGGGKPALLFVGEFAEGKEGADNAGSARRGLLHISGQWAELDGNTDGTWAFHQIDAKSQGVWAGGTDMLRRAVDYCLQDEDAELPVADGVAWNGQPKKITTLAGQLRAVRAIDLAGDGKLVLFIAGEQGDHLLACDPQGGNFSDITATRQLRSKSQAFAWGDFSGNGRLDLISWDGKAVSLHAQQVDGTFQARVLDLGTALENGGGGLAALASGAKGPASLLMSSSKGPVLVAFNADGKPSASPLPAAGIDLKQFGKPGPCLVGDFDGDSNPDIFQLFTTGSVLFPGQGPGKFGPGQVCAIKAGSGDSAASVGDFDADGRLDVLCASSEGVRLWQNEGAGKFNETLGLSGEIAYISKPRAVDCMAGDFNNDGRQDALIAYRGQSPHLFFNRGFRSFGHAHTLDLAERQLLPAAEQGQQSACLGDFNGDGAQDMVLALNNGEIWILFRENEDRQALSAIAALPSGSPYQGPVTVTGWNGKRCLGSWNVGPGTSPAFFGRNEPGPLTLKWRLPGGQEQQKEVVVEKPVVRVEIK